MLEPFKHILDQKRLILASSSPRRVELLRQLGLMYEVIPPTFDESTLNVSDFESHEAYTVELARRKAISVISEESTHAYKRDAIVIGADTIVSMSGRIYGKPKSPDKAQQFLSELSGRDHKVITGVCMITKSDTVKFHDVCRVTMDRLSDEVIHSYVRTLEPLDKAGAYGIQGFGGSLVKKIEGDYSTVVGLPLNKFCKHLISLIEGEKYRADILKKLPEDTHFPWHRGTNFKEILEAKPKPKEIKVDSEGK